MFVQIINQLAKEFGKRTTKRTFRPIPSMAGPERCIRSMVYIALGVEGKDFPGRTTMVFEDGNWHEELTLQWCERSVLRPHSHGMAVNIPIPIDTPSYYCKGCKKTIPPKTMHSHIDWLVTEPTMEECIVEHKAVSTYAWDRYAKGEVPWDYIYQTCLSLRGVNEVSPLIRRFSLLIKNKNTAQYLELEGVYDSGPDTGLIRRRLVSRGDLPPDIFDMNLPILLPFEKSMEKFQSVLDYAKRGELPERPFDYDTTFPCEYCPHYGTCWDGYLEEFKTLPIEAEATGEISDGVRYYKELGAQIRELEKQKDEVQTSLKDWLREGKLQSARSAEYIFGVKPSIRKIIDTSRIDPKNIPQDAISAKPVLTFFTKNTQTKKREKKK